MFEPFETFTGIVAPLDRPDVDTDQIIPKQFLKRVERSGYGQFVFNDWATEENGDRNPDWVLNQSPYDAAEILLTRQNFGCGSSREHAVWALTDFGFQTIIAPSFADIFKNNSFKNGLLLIELEDDQVEELFEREADADGAYRLTVNLEERTIRSSDGFQIDFKVDPFRRKCLLEGLDDIQLTLQKQDDIDRYERDEQRFWQNVDHDDRISMASGGGAGE